MSKEGIYGGIELMEKPEYITLYDIFIALESKNPMFKTDFSTNISGEKVDTVIQIIDRSLKDAENSMKKSLKKTTISDIIKLYF
ncbi:MAG: putative transcriptional regulator [Lachnospiraceae bacterium]|jgi:DNA-binding IscR family transcriptional regulator|nr:putative transcriptional regulator [Lachnospiraceae bacterium]